MKCVNFLYCFLVVQFIYGQNHNFRNYSIDEGLEQFQIAAITQDKFGNLWIGGIGTGLTKYDGISFKSASEALSQINVHGLLFDTQNDLWIRGGHTVSKYNGSELVEYPLQKEEFVNLITSDMVHYGGTIYTVSSFGGLYRITNQVEKLDSANGWFLGFISSITKYEDKIIATSYDKGLYVIDPLNNSYKVIEYPKFLKDEQVYSIAFKGEDFYFLTNKGLYSSEEKFFKGEIKLIESFRELRYLKLKGFENHLYAYGLESILVLNDKSSYKITSANDFSNYQIISLTEDRQGNLWVGTNGGGVYMSSGEDFMQLTEKEGLLGEVVFTVQKNNNEYFLGTNRGLNKVILGNEGKLHSEVLWDKSFIRVSVVDNDGITWFGNNNSFLLYKDGRQIDQVYVNPIRFGNPFSAIPHVESGIWAATPFGAFHIKRKGVSMAYTMEEGLKGNDVGGLYQWDKERVIVGTTEGMNVIQGDSIMDFEIIPELKDTAVFDIKRNGDHLWFTLTDNGLAKYNLSSKKLSFINSQNGLPSNICKSINFDDQGNVWVGTVKGLVRMTAKANDQYDIRIFTSKEGFNGHRAVMYSTLKDADGIWFGTVRGAYKIFPENIDDTQSKIPIYFDEVSLLYDSKELAGFSDSSTKWNNIPYHPELPYSQNSIAFSFKGINFKDPEDVYYSYYMKGLDTEWTTNKRTNSASYANLPPGEYTFYVKASSKKNKSVSDSISYSFVVLTPFWLTWWFIGGVVLVFILLIILINRYYVKRKINYQSKLEAIKREEADHIRRELAMDFHDELGNKLANISTFSSLLRDKVENDNQAKYVADTLSDSVNSLMDGTREFIWSINPKHDNLFEVLAYLKDFGEELFKGSYILFEVVSDIDDELRGVKLQTGWARQIVLIFKEAMTNVLKHSKASIVRFRFSSTTEHVNIQLLDDGVGIINNGQKHSNGLNNMFERAKRIKSDLEIKNLAAGGTGIYFRIKLPFNRVELLKVS